MLHRKNTDEPAIDTLKIDTLVGERVWVEPESYPKAQRLHQVMGETPRL